MSALPGESIPQIVHIYDIIVCIYEKRNTHRLGPLPVPSPLLIDLHSAKRSAAQIRMGIST
jgi:hypothetical protein